MQLNDYKMSTEYDKRMWLNSLPIIAGLPYFGGKAFIGKYLMNRICNMAVQMDNDGKKADVFLDVFGGGGKIALSIPDGWFDTIVLNDINYGVTSYFECCKEKPDELIALIEKLGSVMNEELFHILAFIRSNDGTPMKKRIKQKEQRADMNEVNEDEDSNYKKYEKYKDLLFDNKVDPLLSAGATYWVTKLDFIGRSDPLKVSYKASIKDNKEDGISKQHEREIIENAIKYAKKEIPRISQLMRKKNIIVERLDFRELVKKYNGKPYKAEVEETMQNKENSKLNKLWYFDSPYHPSTLHNGDKAPYEDTFGIPLVIEMTRMLHNDFIDDYGDIEYFIKSDYDPKYVYSHAMDMIKKYNGETEKIKAKKRKTEKDFERIKIIKEYIGLLEKQKTILCETAQFGDRKIIAFHHFDCLEDNCMNTEGAIRRERQKNSDNREETNLIEIPKVYFKECLGEFTKSTPNKITGEKAMGKEYIWFKGMGTDYMEEMDKDLLHDVSITTKKRLFDNLK